MRSPSFWVAQRALGVVVFALLAVGCQPQPSRPSPAVCEAPSELDLGPHFASETAVARFVVRNTGGQPLTVSDIVSSCSCAGVDAEAAGEWRRVSEFTVPPGGVLQLRALVNVGPDVGQSHRVSVRWATNDPHHSEHIISLSVPKILGGVLADPVAVVFGDVQPGAAVSRRVILYENGVANRSVARITITPADRFTARLADLTPLERTPHVTGGVAFAVVEVTADTTRPG